MSWLVRSTFFVALAWPGVFAVAQEVGEIVRLTPKLNDPIIEGRLVDRSADALVVATSAGDTIGIRRELILRREVLRQRDRSDVRWRSTKVGAIAGAVGGAGIMLAGFGDNEPGLGGMLVVPAALAGGVYGAGVGWVVGTFLSTDDWVEVAQ